MNPIALLFKSRKFLLALLDAVISIVTLVLTTYLSPQSLDLAIKIIAILQPVIVMVIYGIATEDAAEKSANPIPPAPPAPPA
jgi:hypothetical protein